MYVILDLSYLLSAGKRTIEQQLRGVRLIFTDTLGFEAATSSTQNGWEKVMERIEPSIERVRVWHHISYFLKRETAGIGAVDIQEIDTFGRDLSEVDKEERAKLSKGQQGEVQTLLPQRQDEPSESLLGAVMTIADFLKDTPYSQMTHRPLRDCLPLINNLCSDKAVVQKLYNLIRKEMLSQFPQMPSSINAGNLWFIQVQALLVYAADYLRRNLQPPGLKDLPNWKHDMDYIILGVLTGHLASNDSRVIDFACCINPEIKIYKPDGSTFLGRTLLTGSLDTSKDAKKKSTEPTHQDISVAAYYRWLARGEACGNALEDWLSAEQDLKHLTAK